MYTGDSPATLTVVASDDDSGEGLTSAARFAVAAGTTYHFDVDGYGGPAGTLRLKLLPVATLRLSKLEGLPDDGKGRIWIASADGTAIDPSRASKMDAFASCTVSLPMSAWARLAGTFTASNGMFWIEDPDARNLLMRYYTAAERP